jgi:hypothetical protein
MKCIVLWPVWPPRTTKSNENKYNNNNYNNDNNNNNNKQQLGAFYLSKSNKQTRWVRPTWATMESSPCSVMPRFVAPPM